MCSCLGVVSFQDIVMPLGNLTIAEASYETRRNELTKAERSSLDSSANDHDAAPYEDSLFAAQQVTLDLSVDLLRR